jgi:Zinc finger, C2H2 type/Zinc-finger of C2H2 type
MSKTEDPENYFYMCEECNLSFDDYDQHIRDYHADAVVVLKPEKNEETAVYEEMEVEYLEDAVAADNFQCPECFITFGMKKKYDKHIEMVHGPKTSDDFVVFDYDPATKKSRKVTFSMHGPFVDPTTHSSVHRQYYNAFANAPKQTETDHRDMKPAFKRDALKPWEASSAVTCKLCDSKFAHPGALKMHQKAHGSKKVRSLEDVLPEGVLINSDPNTERYFCDICQRSFDMTFKELHIASHGEERIFCKICNRRFDTQENLDSHMRALPDHTPFNFGRRFETDPEMLKKRPYECGTCGKRFHRPHEKVKHERIHDGRWFPWWK